MNKVSKIFSWVLLVPAFLPLVYIDGLLYPYMTLKTTLFRGLGVFALALFLYLIFSGHEFYWVRLRQKLTWLPGLLLVVAFVSSFLGVDFYHSFWSTFSRGDGLLTLLVAVLFFYLTLLQANRDFLIKFFKVVSLVGTLVAFHAFLQWTEVSFGFSVPFISPTEGRLGGTLGNAAFLASYLSLTFLITLATAHNFFGKYQKFFYGAAGLQVLVVFLTATRGSILALVISGLVALTYLAFKGEKKQLQIRARQGLAVCVVLFGLFFSFREQLADSSLEPIRRIASISVEDSTVSSRLFVWRGIFSESLKKPLLGYGAENISILFDRVYDPDRIIEQWFDRSHNVYVDYIAQYGVVGLILYVGMISSLLVLGFRLWRKKEGWAVYVVLFGIVYAVQNFFIFDTASTFWLLCILLAGVFSLGQGREHVKTSLITSRFSVFGIVFSAVVLLCIVPVSITPLRANMLLARGYNNHMVDVPKSVSAMEEGFALDTYASLEYGYQAYAWYAERQAGKLSGGSRIEAYKNTLSVLSSNFNRYLYDARTATYLAHVIELAPPEIERDNILLSKAVDRAILLSPKRTQPWFIQANFFIRRGDVLGGVEKIKAYTEAISILTEYATVVPENAETRYVIANLYVALGDKKNATLWADKGSLLYKGRIDGARQALRYYLAIQDWEKALPFLQDIVRETPTDYESTYDLAKLYFLTGDKVKALEIFEQVKKEKPELLNTDPAFLRAIKP
jgi:O-antigen ligase/tetratricopeptide (TPR) repeat protein